MWKSILAIALGLACLVMVTETSQAKGRSGGGGRSSHNAPARHQTNVQQEHPPKHQPNRHHKHHHKNGPTIDIDGGGGGLDASSSDASSPDTDDDEEDVEAETALYGVEITALYKGTAAKEGLEVGDTILSFNGTPTPDFEALAKAVARSGSSKSQVVVIREDGGARETVTLFPQNGRIGVSGERVRVGK